MDENERATTGFRRLVVSAWAKYHNLSLAHCRLISSILVGDEFLFFLFLGLIIVISVLPTQSVYLEAPFRPRFFFVSRTTLFSLLAFFLLQGLTGHWRDGIEWRTSPQ